MKEKLTIHRILMLGSGYDKRNTRDATEVVILCAYNTNNKDNNRHCGYLFESSSRDPETRYLPMTSYQSSIRLVVRYYRLMIALTVQNHSCHGCFAVVVESISFLLRHPERTKLTVKNVTNKNHPRLNHFCFCFGCR